MGVIEVLRRLEKDHSLRSVLEMTIINYGALFRIHHHVWSFLTDLC